jgi:hypothetical protein
MMSRLQRKDEPLRTVQSVEKAVNGAEEGGWWRRAKFREIHETREYRGFS